MVTTWLSSMAFPLLPIWLQTLVAIDSESRVTSLPSFCAPPSEVAGLFNSNLSRPFLGQVVDLDLLICTGFDSEHEVLFLCHNFTQTPMTDRKIERSDGHCFDWQQLLADSIEIFISHEKKKWLVAAQNLQGIARVVAYFLQASRSRPAATAADSETPCVCARPSDPRKQSRRAAPRAWPLILPSKPSITFWNSLQRDCQMTLQGLKLGLKLELCRVTNELLTILRFYHLQNYSINYVEFEFFVSPQNLSQVEQSF